MSPSLSKFPPSFIYHTRARPRACDAKLRSSVKNVESKFPLISRPARALSLADFCGRFGRVASGELIAKSRAIRRCFSTNVLAYACTCARDKHELTSPDFVMSNACYRAQMRTLVIRSEPLNYLPGYSDPRREHHVSSLGGSERKKHKVRRLYENMSIVFLSHRRACGV